MILWSWSNGRQAVRSERRTGQAQLALALTPEPNHREESYNKIATREAVGSIGANPFMIGANYSDDVAIQSRFLIPQLSSSKTPR